MELADVEVFLVLADELHFGRTAQRLYVSRARVTQRVQAFEHEIGGQLFERTSRHVRLTPLGTRLRDELRPVHEQLNGALAAARADARRPAGQLRLGFTNTTVSVELDQLVADFEKAHPDCEVVLKEVWWPEAVPALDAELDVLTNWLVFDDPGLTMGPTIAELPRMLAVGSAHPLATERSVSAEVLAHYPVTNWSERHRCPEVQDAILPPHTPSGRPALLHETPVRTMAEGASQIARGLTIHPTVASAVVALNHENIVLVPIEDLPPLRLGLIWRTAHENARIRALAATATALRDETGKR